MVTVSKVSDRVAWKCATTVHKAHSGLYNLAYHQRLICLGLESLESGRLRFDLVLLYKIVFGLTVLRSEDFCINVSRKVLNLRGHPYQ